MMNGFVPKGNQPLGPYPLPEFEPGLDLLGQYLSLQEKRGDVTPSWNGYRVVDIIAAWKAYASDKGLNDLESPFHTYFLLRRYPAEVFERNDVIRRRFSECFAGIRRELGGVTIGDKAAGEKEAGERMAAD